MTQYDDGPFTDWELVQSGDIADAIDHLADLLRPLDRAAPKMSTCVAVEVALRDIAERARSNARPSPAGPAITVTVGPVGPPDPGVNPYAYYEAGRRRGRHEAGG